MAQILRKYAAEYVRAHAGQAVPQVQSTLAKLCLCRTAALGGRWWRCAACQAECKVYNSCGDRHCPQCGGAKRADWLESAAELLRPGVDYYQVVFTIPDKLSSLVLGNRRVLFNLLFRSAWQALDKTIAAEQGSAAAALMVLHTWNRRPGDAPHPRRTDPNVSPGTEPTEPPP